MDDILIRGGTVDASGAYVIPGIIDTHTHLDGALWWNPALDPLPSHGNTSMVFGNCGNSIAPLDGADTGARPGGFLRPG